MRSPFCSKKASLFLFFYNQIARLLLRLRKDRSEPHLSTSPKILLCCFGALGDVLLATSLLPFLRDKWPSASFSFLCEPRAANALQGISCLSNIYTAPCWMQKSKMKSLLFFWLYSWFVYPKIAKKLYKERFDAAIELHLFFPNSLPILRRARIPKRIAFACKGFDLWITDPLSLPTRWDYLPRLYLTLLLPLGITTPKMDRPPSSLRQEGAIVLHIGTSDIRKEWPMASWKKLIQLLRELPFPLLFTGQGKRDEELLAELPLLPGENLCNQQDFLSFSSTIQKARLLISVDSVSVHLAALHQTPFIALYLYNESLDFWLPNQETSRLFVLNTCYYQNRHKQAIYQDLILPVDVFQAVHSLLQIKL